MINLKSIKKTLKSILSTIHLELRLQSSKFIILLTITVTFFTLINVIPYISRILPSNQADYLHDSMFNYIFLIIIYIGAFFSGIICSEYKEKTGLIFIPVQKKSNLLAGKFIANYILILGMGTIYYGFMGIFNYYFYADVLPTLFISYTFLALFLLALASLSTFISSFMPSALSVVLIIMGLLLVSLFLVDPFLRSLSIHIEPIYSITYFFNLVVYALYPNFMSIQRYNSLSNRWLFPSPFLSLIEFIIITVIFLILSYVIFKRREL